MRIKKGASDLAHGHSRRVAKVDGHEGSAPSIPVWKVLAYGVYA